MTILTFIRDHAPRSGPKGPQLEDLLKKAMADGILKPGDRLPPMRQAAWEAGCSLGTLSRVYTALERQGLIRSEVGRGSFVNAPDTIAANVILPYPAQAGNNAARPNFAVNEIANPEAEKLLRKALARAAEKIPSQHLSGYADGMGLAAYKPRLMTFLPPSLREASPERLIPTHGVQNALYTVLGRITGPGDGVAVEEYSYPGIASALSFHGLQGFPLPLDDEGLEPEAFETLCQKGRIRLLMTTATGQNPTCGTASLARRQAIAGIAEKYGVIIVEDDIYGFLYDETLPPYAALLPDQAIYLTGLSKRIVPGLRFGLALAPPRLALLMAQGITTQSWMVSPMLVAASAELGDRIELIRKCDLSRRGLADQRAAYVKEMLGPYLQEVRTCRSHAWLRLPEGTDDESCMQAAEANGVSISRGRNFANRQGSGTGHVRITLLTCESEDLFETGVTRLRDSLKELARPYRGSKPLTTV